MCITYLDVLPQGVYNDSSGGCVNAEDPAEPLVKFEVRGLVVQLQVYSALYTLVTRPLHLGRLSSLKFII